MQRIPTPTQHLTVRPAVADDRIALATLAQLDGAPVVFDAVLVAAQDDRIVAAVTAGGGALGDPFRHTDAIIEFMRSETAARMFGTPVAEARHAAVAAGYGRRRSRRYWRAKPATNAGL